MSAPTSPLSPSQLAELRAALEKKRAELQRSVAQHGKPRPDGDERPVEDLDLAERDIEDADATALAEHGHRLLGEVEAALARIAAGTYGRSEASGEPIPFARLKAVPWARRGSDEP